MWFSVTEKKRTEEETRVCVCVVMAETVIIFMHLKPDAARWGSTFRSSELFLYALIIMR